MEVLNAAGVTPVALHKATFSSERRTEPRKLFPFRFPRPSTSSVQVPAFAALSSALALANGALAKALTYEEALEQSASGDYSSEGFLDFDIGQFFDGFVKFALENPLVVGGGAAVAVVPLLLSQILQKPKPWGAGSARNAYAKLSEDAEAQLLDIREGRDFKEVGSPDVRSLKKKAVSITYRGDDKQGFLKKLALKFKDPGSTTLFILDKFDGNSEFVAELVTANGFKGAFAIKDGAEGTRGWMNSGLPWSPPKKALSVDGLKDAIAGAFGESSDGLPVTLGLAAAAGLSIFAFAEDRKVTLQQVDEFLNNKIAPKELVDEIKMIGKAFLPAPSSVKTLPAPAEGKSDASTLSAPVQKADAVLETKPDLKEEKVADPPAQVNSVPKAEVSNGIPRALSPFPYYPDFKPPSSPSPSPP